MKLIGATGMFVLGVAALAGAQGASVIHGTVKKVDSAAKTVAVATANGAEEVVRFTDKTIVHGTAAGAKDAWQGIQQGSEIVVHATGTGASKTAVEVDNLGKGGLRVAEGTISKVGDGGKTVVVKTANGAEETFDVTANAVGEASKTAAQGAEKAGRYGVYYTEEAGKKIAHFFKKF